MKPNIHTIVDILLIIGGIIAVGGIICGISSCSKEEKKNEIITIKKSLPKNSKNIKHIGNKWFIFELEGNCFILADHYKTSVLSKYPCEDYDNNET